MAQHTSPSTQSNRQLNRTLMALRLGATAFGVLTGVACYVILDQFTAIGMIPAFVVGLAFALLTRTAAASLARDWLVQSARRTSEGRQDSPISSKPL
jgi:hypothetical protein